ncbi:hypothetical protein HK100_006309 [Physocladia obscura]|uniref:GH26 domain-containing protein n=1 Tax=Physocladia obscura TaxID=109957 RepID=A0AAD5XJ13_9FUNG|nr:hypothetical protein HK100_006309 [Physocladia obscura]
MKRHALLHAMFWLKAFVAMLMGLFCLMWFAWRIYDLHSRASPTFYTGLQAVTNAFLPNGTVNPTCYHNTSSGLARLEPAITSALTLGFSLDWSYDTPTTIVDKLNGYKPLVFNTFMDFDTSIPGYFSASLLNWFGSECGRTGAMLELTIQPTAVPISLYQQVHFDTLSAALYQINSRYGVPILLRFGHEMNGPWNTWSFDPIGYPELFRNMTLSVRKHTNMTAMVWGPNIGFGYPFNNSGSTTPPTNKSDPRFALLDTNGDGVINEYDDPYGPYYPGDDYVDWVALSLYYYPPDETHNHDIAPGFFDAYLTGIGYNQANGNQWWELYYNFYARFCGPNGHGKPMMLPETGAPYLYNETYLANGEVSTVPGPTATWPGDPLAVSAVTIRQEWYDSLFNQTVLSIYPKLKLVVNFEEEKILSNYWRDWRLTNDSTQLAAFQQIITGFQKQLPSATSFTFGCDGTVMLT